MLHVLLVLAEAVELKLGLRYAFYLVLDLVFKAQLWVIWSMVFSGCFYVKLIVLNLFVIDWPKFARLGTHIARIGTINSFCINGRTLELELKYVVVPTQIGSGRS